jgi:hypothetical protein
LFKFCVVYHKLTLDINDLLAGVRVIDLCLANAELGKAAESGLEDLNETRVHVLNNAIIMQLLNGQVKLAEQLALFYGNTHLLQAADSMRNNQVRIHIVYQEFPQEPESILIHRINNRNDLLLVKVDVEDALLVGHCQHLFEFGLTKF